MGYSEWSIGSHLMRTEAVHPGTRTVLQPLHRVRFTAGSLEALSGCEHTMKGENSHLHHLFIRDELHRPDVRPRDPLEVGCTLAAPW